MSLIWFDGFELQGVDGSFGRFTAGSGGRYDDGGSNNGIDAGRFGGTGANLIGAGASFTILRKDSAFSNQSVLGIGCSVKYTLFPVSSTPFSLVARDGSTSQAYAQLDTANRLVKAFRGDDTLLGSVFFPFVDMAWYFFEAEFTIDNSTGRIRVWIDDTLVLDVNSVDTQNTGNAYANGFQVSGRGPGVVDDLHVWNNAGSIRNSRIGPRRVLTPLLNGDGTTNDWTPSTGTDNYALVDEQGGPNASDYVESDTVNDIDLYTITPLGITVDEITGLQVVIHGYETGLTNRDLKSVVRPDATNYFGNTVQLISTAKYVTDIWEQNPETTADWTVSDVDNTEIGMRLET